MDLLQVMLWVPGLQAHFKGMQEAHSRRVRRHIELCSAIKVTGNTAREWSEIQMPAETRAIQKKLTQRRR